MHFDKRRVKIIMLRKKTNKYHHTMDQVYLYEETHNFTRNSTTTQDDMVILKVQYGAHPHSPLRGSAPEIKTIPL